MTFGRALGYFFREAMVSLVRSWKVSLLAVVIIAVSLFVGGAFLVAGQNLAAVAERARDESRLVVYFEPGTPMESVSALAEEAEEAPWVAGARTVSADEARRRFATIFPALSDLVEGEETPLPPSVEIELLPAAEALLAAAEGSGGDAPGDLPGDVGAWLAGLAEVPGVSMVDDDRDWVAQLSTVVAVVRGLGLTLGGVLLGAAVFTIGSVIRLTAYLYEDEITIMRLVGATEFFIRGPFYAEGLLQGLLGGALAAGGLAAAFWTAAERLGPSLVGRLLIARPPSVGQLLGLVALGAAAGLVGAVLSLRREALGEPPVDEA
jgi:cell division transport system permease protein